MKNLKYILLIAGIFIFIFIINYFGFFKILAIIKKSNYLYIIAGICLFLFAHFIRGIKWYMFISPVKKIPIIRFILTFIYSTSIGYFTPAKSGEGILVFSLNKEFDIQYSASTSIVYLCKTLEYAAAGILTFICLSLFIFQNFSNLSDKILYGLIFYFFIFILSIAVLILIALFSEQLIKKIHSLFFNKNKFIDKIILFLQNISFQFKNFNNKKTIIIFFLLSFINLFIDSISIYFYFNAIFKIDLITVFIVRILTLGLSNALMVPAGIGITSSGFIAFLYFYKYNPFFTASAAVLSKVLNSIAFSISGLICFFLLRISRK